MSAEISYAWQRVLREAIEEDQQQGLSRFTSCVLQSGLDLPYRAIKTNTGDSLNVVIQIERRPGRWFISEVLEINRYDPTRTHLTSNTRRGKAHFG